MMIQWFEDRILASIPIIEANLDRFYRYACIYAECGQQAAALACALCRLVVECGFRGSSMYGAIQAYTGDNKVYYLPNLPMVSRDDPDQLLHVALVAAELLMAKEEKEMDVPVVINMDRVD